MSENDEKAHLIIHSAAASTAAINAGLAQIPGSDNAVIIPIQIAMIIAIDAVYGRNLNETTTLSILSAASALLVIKDTLNWRQDVTDEFAQNTLGLQLGKIFGPLHIVGLGIATACVISGL